MTTPDEKARPGCQACTRPVADQAYLCPRCSGFLRRDLEAVPALLVELLTSTARLGRAPAGERGGKMKGGAKGSPLAFDWPSASADWDLRATVGSWARLVAEERGVRLALRQSRMSPVHAGPVCRVCQHTTCMRIRSSKPWIDVSRPDVSGADPHGGVALWLADQLQWVVHQRWAAEVADEIGYAVRTARQSIDRTVTHRFPVGPCPVEGCYGTVHAFIPTDDRGASMTCDYCQSTWASHQWLRAGKRILDTIAAREGRAG